MKKNIVLLLTISLAMIWLSGCARVNLGLDKEENIKFDRAGGYASPERGLDVLEQQSRTQTLVLLQKQLRAAILLNDEIKIQKTLKTIDSINNRSLINHQMIWLENVSIYTVEITGGEFKGEVLGLGDESTTKQVHIGEYLIPIKWTNTITGAYGKKILHKMVTKNKRYLTITN